jgi:hypothetical protein
VSWRGIYSLNGRSFSSSTIVSPSSSKTERSTPGGWNWEIYGPGAGGYSSSGPYGNWQDDIRAWLNSGSLLALDIIDWDAAQLQSRNLSTYTRDSANLTKTTNFFLPHDADPVFGASGSSAKYAEGEIVVTAIRANSDQSLTYRFASYDPYTHQPVSWVENITFLDMARANADGNVIRFDLAAGEADLTPDEHAATSVIRQGMQEMIASLQALNPTGYFEVEGWGRIRVSELITLLSRMDWEIAPNSRFAVPDTVALADRNGADPILILNRTRLLEIGGDPILLFSVLAHELAHTTRVGWENRSATLSYEIRTNDVGRAILQQIGKGAYVHPRLAGGYGATVIRYEPNLPTT